jgi:hypothetical protein
MKAYSGKRDIAQLFLSIGTTYIWMVNFMPQPLSTSEQKDLVLSTILGGRHIRLGTVNEIKNTLPLLGFEPQIAQPVAFAVLVHSLYGWFNFYCDWVVSKTIPVMGIRILRFQIIVLDTESTSLQPNCSNQACAATYLLLFIHAYGEHTFPFTFTADVHQPCSYLKFP